MTTTKSAEKPICTYFLSDCLLSSLNFSMDKKSIQKEVVRAVSAESELAYVAAMMPNKKVTAAKVPNCPPNANPGYKLSVKLGIGIPFDSEYRYNNAPKLRNNKLIKTNTQ